MICTGIGVRRSFEALIQVLQSLAHFNTTVPRFCRDFERAMRMWNRGRERDCCLDLPAAVYKRADPLLYSQQYLMSKGLAVTWDNPDIDIFDDGTLVNPWDLAPGREYRVRVRCWNGSYDAPAMGMAVRLVYLSFGMGTTTTYVGTAYVDLGVKGSSQCPEFAEFSWRTPEQAGHYCLKAHLEWPDDANPANNIGQKNTQVSVMQSPAEFQFEVRNDASIRRVIEFDADTYELPKLSPCPDTDSDEGSERQLAPGRLAESRRRWAAVLAQQSYGMFPIPKGWRVVVEPRHLILEPRASAMIHVRIDADDAAFAGRRAFNIHGFAFAEKASRRAIGGVTVFVEKPRRD